MKYESFLKYHWKHVFASRWLERDCSIFFSWNGTLPLWNWVGWEGRVQGDVPGRGIVSWSMLHPWGLSRVRTFERQGGCYLENQNTAGSIAINILFCWYSTILFCFGVVYPFVSGSPLSIQLHLQPQVSYLHSCSDMHAHHMHWSVQSVIISVSVLYYKTLTEYYPASGLSTHGISFSVMYSSLPRCKIPQVIFTYFFHLLLLPLCWETVV